ncbi:hypothetical protein HOG16_04255 [Candidatus Woesearchaeota archaeon]|jgi:CBS-domain-containing membrane protein|nr:hypothetical protein [Candidatus Woesearchaeota archaeon]MBT4321934.1 hypothetical protein [Candidatus Woesearchaeota archaeon]MBT4631286.1 hypothetical protein [Candidatus Woesearchaeota archaeon]
MNFDKIIKREKILWHNHFIPSLLAGLLVGLITFLYQATLSNILLFSSVGASALILTNSKSHHLTKLRTTIISYFITIIISLGVYYLNKLIVVPLYLNIFLLVFLIGIVMFLANSFHPPAVAAGIAFIVLDRGVIELLYLFFYIIVLLILIRFLVYTLSQHLSVKEFRKEFGRI